MFNDPGFKAKTVGFISGKFSFGDNEETDGNVVGIYKFTPSEWTEWEKRIKGTGVFYDTDIKTWIKKIAQSPIDYAIIQPDGLLDYLKKNNVKYLILASLRMNPYENTGNIINTLQRYVFFIQLKYPNMFRVVSTTGTDEVAQLLEINYQL